MVILSLDQANKTGYSLYKDEELISYGLLNFDKFKGTAEKYSMIKSCVNDLIDEYKPDLVAIEDIQYQKNADVHKKLAMLLGVLENNLYEQGMYYIIVHSKTWRATCGIKGKSRKDQKKNAQMFAKRLFDVDVQEDIADAICIGYHVTRAVKNNT